MKKKINQCKWTLLLLIIILNSSIAISQFIKSWGYSVQNKKDLSDNRLRFNTTKAFSLIQKQVDLGPRYPGSKGLEELRQLIKTELLPTQKWRISYQNFSKRWIDNQDIILVNIICSPTIYDSSQPSFLLMAHYDTRLWADNDPNPLKQKNNVLGANDGASGVAVALELGRVLLECYNISNFQLVFFDGEDQGGINGWGWLIGSRYYVESQDFKSQNLLFAILFDMVAGTNATFKRELYSDQYAGALVSIIWNKADTLGFNNYFVNKTGGRIIDDHLPLIQKGIPAIDIIDDFSHRYKPWHTSFDNMSFIDLQTLEAVGYPLEAVLRQGKNVSEWITRLSTVNYQTSVIIFNLSNGYFLSVIIILFLKSRQLKLKKSEFYLIK
ncbi:MAG: M28 family peptidase [Promethearchaeota archaeon]